MNMKIHASAMAIVAIGVAASFGRADQQGTGPSEFPIGFWHGPPAEFNTLETWKRAADCNFTFCGPARGFSVAENLRMLGFCKQAGLRTIVVDGRIGWKMLADDNWRDVVRQVVADYGGHPALYGYYLQDEPSSEIFEPLGMLSREFLARDPSRIPYINLFPTYASTKQLGNPTYSDHLRKFVRTVRPAVLSYDHYCLMKDGSDRKDYFENLSLIREVALGAGIPPWNIILSVPHFGYRDPSAGEMRWQVYTSLAYGMKGILYFTYWTEPEWEEGGTAIVDSRGAPGRLYPIVGALNAEMRVLGKTLLGLRSTGVFHCGEIPQGCRRIGGDASLTPVGDPPLVMGFFEDASGGEYAMVVNRDHGKAVACELTAKPHITGVSKINPSTGGEEVTPIGTGTVALHLEAGDGRLLKLQSHFNYPARAKPATEVKFQFDREGDMEGWGDFRSLDAPTVANGILGLVFTGDDPSLTRSFIRVGPDTYAKIKVRMRLASGNPVGQLFWTTGEDPRLDDAKYLNFPVIPDGQWHEYEIPVASHTNWRGKAIRSIRLDPTTGGAKRGDRVEIDWIVGE